MATHFDRERALHTRLAEVLGEALPNIELAELELNEQQEQVRLFIDSDDGVGFEECEAVTHVVHDLVSDYELEVSSLGMERPLRAPEHFETVIGEPIRLRRAGVHKAGHFVLVAVDRATGITVRPDGGEDVHVPFGDIVRCRLIVTDFFAESKGRAAKQKGKS